MSTNTDGYLDESVSSVFEADLYIAAMGRSGSTWLSNMLTNAPTHWVMIEPWFINGVTGKNIREKAGDFGIPTDAKLWVARQDTDELTERYKRFLNPQLCKLDKWGVKEVRGDFHQPTIVTIRPKKVIILVRNIRDVALSLLEKWKLQGSVENRGPNWINEYCESSARSLIDIFNSRDGQIYEQRLIKYENLLTDSDKTLSEIQNWLDWPMNGDPFADLKKFGREHEIHRNSGSKREFFRTLPDGSKKIADDIADNLKEYQSTFGYHLT